MQLFSHFARPFPVSLDRADDPTGIHHLNSTRFQVESGITRGQHRICKEGQIEINPVTPTDEGLYVLTFGEAKPGAFGFEFRVEFDENRKPKPPEVIDATKGHSLRWKEGDSHRFLKAFFKVESKKPAVYWLRYNTSVEENLAEDVKSNGNSSGSISVGHNSNGGDKSLPRANNIAETSGAKAGLSGSMGSSNGGSGIQISLESLIYSKTRPFEDDAETTFNNLRSTGAFEVFRSSESRRVTVQKSFYVDSYIDVIKSHFGSGKRKSPREHFYKTLFNFDDEPISVHRHGNACYLCLIIDQFYKLFTVHNFCPEIEAATPAPPEPMQSIDKTDRGNKEGSSEGVVNSHEAPSGRGGGSDGSGGSDESEGSGLDRVIGGNGVTMNLIIVFTIGIFAVFLAVVAIQCNIVRKRRKNSMKVEHEYSFSGVSGKTRNEKERKWGQVWGDYYLEFLRESEWG